MERKNYSFDLMFKPTYIVTSGNDFENTQPQQVPERVPIPDESFSRFYPRYGAGKIRRSTNQYRNGNRGNGDEPSREQRSSKLKGILSAAKKARKRGFN